MIKAQYSAGKQVDDELAKLKAEIGPGAAADEKKELDK